MRHLPQAQGAAQLGPLGGERHDAPVVGLEELLDEDEVEEAVAARGGAPVLREAVRRRERDARLVDPLEAGDDDKAVVRGGAAGAPDRTARRARDDVPTMAAAVIVAVPGSTPVTLPLWSTVATVGLSLSQVIDGAVPGGGWMIATSAAPRRSSAGTTGIVYVGSVQAVVVLRTSWAPQHTA